MVTFSRPNIGTRELLVTHFVEHLRGLLKYLPIHTVWERRKEAIVTLLFLHAITGCDIPDPTLLTMARKCHEDVNQPTEGSIDRFDRSTINQASKDASKLSKRAINNFIKKIAERNILY